MSVTWLHISDFHIKAGGDLYDQHVVLSALVDSVRYFHEKGRTPDLIFATGDIAHAGRAAEYELASVFFDDLLKAAGIGRNRLWVIPGNHDVDRDAGAFLLRTLGSREEADRYFNPATPKPHMSMKLGAFVKWHDEYFKGIRAMPADSTCGPVELVEVRGRKLGILPINSALFCQDESDHNQLWIGRRCLETALEKLEEIGAEASVALIHHPLDWLHDAEASNISASMQDKVDVILRGHLHKADIVAVASAHGEALICASGAAYQTRLWPQRALYGSLAEDRLTIHPISYKDDPKEVWRLDTSVFPDDDGYERTFDLRRDDASKPPAPIPAAAPLPRFKSNILARGSRPFVGRDGLLNDILVALGDAGTEIFLVLRGSPGTGKSALAREFARRQKDRYPGGTFFIDASSDAVVVDLATIGRNILDLDFPADLSLRDQAQQALYALAATPALLIYDNVVSVESIGPWLPAAGTACQILMTTLLENWDPGWRSLEVKPLEKEASLELIEKLAGREVAGRFGEKLAEVAGGLPVQICPAAISLAYEARRGRLDKASVALADEAKESFRGVYARLERPARLLLHAAAALNTQRVPRDELSRHLREALQWTEAETDDQFDACQDLHLLEGAAELQMHRLFATFLADVALAEEDATALASIRKVQAGRLVEVARELRNNPARSDLAAAITAFPLAPDSWWDLVTIADGEWVGAALTEIGRFDEARPWYEQAVEARQKGDANGKVDHADLGHSLHQVGYCLSSMGKYDEALPWFEQAVEAQRKGDAQGRVDNKRLGTSLHQVGYCLWSTSKYDEARMWFEQAAEALRKGDEHGRVDHQKLGMSLHQAGYCLWSAGKYDEARTWFEQAVDAHRKGDVSGRVDHAELGKSLGLLGACLSYSGRYDHARPWYEQALEAQRKGDVYGRVDHAELGRVLHQVGYCLLSTGKYEEARSWFEKAAEAMRKGDVFGRVNQANVALSLRVGARCLRELREDQLAADWERQADQIDPQDAATG